MGRWFACAVVVACFGSGCAAEIGDETLAEEEGEVGVTAAAITNGAVLSNEEYTGILALQVYSQTWQSWTTTCTATLMTNRKAITAAHCVDEDPYGRQLYAKMGTQRIAVTGRWINPDWDVAVIRLATPMKMWNWNNTGFLTSPAKVTTTGYGRAAYNGTNASLDGASMLCLGHGGARASRPQPPLTYALMPTVFGSDRLEPRDELHTYRNSSNQLQEPGDSGGPCLTGLSTIGAPLAFVQSGCFASIGFCYGAGAESWAAWALWALVAP